MMSLLRQLSGVASAPSQRSLRFAARRTCELQFVLSSQQARRDVGLRQACDPDVVGERLGFGRNAD